MVVYRFRSTPCLHRTLWAEAILLVYYIKRGCRADRAGINSPRYGAAPRQRGWKTRPGPSKPHFMGRCSVDRPLHGRSVQPTGSHCVVSQQYRFIAGQLAPRMISTEVDTRSCRFPP